MQTKIKIQLIILTTIFSLVLSGPPSKCDCKSGYVKSGDICVLGVINAYDCAGIDGIISHC
jgi:hypothetical protein